MINVKDFTRENVDINGSHLQGYIEISYANLVCVLGEPEMMDDKVQVQWDLKFSDGTIVSIYDWKSTQNPADITLWHIGGHSKEALKKVKTLFLSSHLLGKIETWEQEYARNERIHRQYPKG